MKRLAAALAFAAAFAVSWGQRSEYIFPNASEARGTELLDASGRLRAGGEGKEGSEVC